MTMAQMRDLRQNLSKSGYVPRGKRTSQGTGQS